MVVAATAARTASPAGCPYVSLTRLKWSTSMMPTATGVRVRTARASSWAASPRHVGSLSRPVFPSTLASAASCLCRTDRCCQTTSGTANKTTYTECAAAKVTSSPRHSSAALPRVASAPMSSARAEVCGWLERMAASSRLSLTNRRTIPQPAASSIHKNARNPAPGPAPSDGSAAWKITDAAAYAMPTAAAE